MTKACSALLDGLGQLLVCRELGVERDVAEASRDDAAVLLLVPVVEAVAPVVWHLEEALRDRLGRDHLPAGRDDQPLDRAEQPARIAVGADDDGGAVELLERLDARVLADLDARLRCEAASRRTQRAGWSTPSGRWRSAAVKRPASGGSKPSIHSAAKPAATRASYSARSSSRSSSSTAIRSEPTRRKASPASASIVSIACSVHAIIARARLLADRLRGDVERGGHAAQRKAAVAAARSLGHLARVVDPDALACLCEPQRRRATRHAGADDDDFGVVDGDAGTRRRRLAEPVGGHGVILRGREPPSDAQERARIQPRRAAHLRNDVDRPLRARDPSRGLAAAGVAATLAAALAWFGPPGSDFAAHLYQSGLFEDHGFGIWNNFWYAGRYSFVTYSLLYYPLAALFGIKLLAVASIATAALAFGVVAAREWGPASRWSNRSFAVVWAGVVLSGAFPFALGMALALLALWALQAGRRGRFALLTVLVLARARSRSCSWPSFSPASASRGRRAGRARAPARDARRSRPRSSWCSCASSLRGPVPVLAARVRRGVRLLRLRDPAHVARAAAGMLRWIYVVYLVACTAAYLVPSSLGENIARLRYAAIPIAILTLSLRRWRPLPLAVLALSLAVAWNLTPLAGSFVKTSADPAADPAYWAPAVRSSAAPLTVLPRRGGRHRRPLARRLSPGSRDPDRARLVPAGRLPAQRPALHETRPHAYMAWLRSLGVRYVVLPDAPLDYSAKEEGALIAGGRSGLRVAFRSAHTTIYAVPSPRPIVTGPGRRHRARDRAESDHARARPPRPLPHRDELVAVLAGAVGCLSKGTDGTVRLAKRAGVVRLELSVNAQGALAALEGGSKPAARAELRRHRASPPTR